MTPTSGSSPLTRGKPDRNSHVTVQERLIPAHAGKTGAVEALGLGPGAHPRSRGENARLPIPQPRAQGSSPLTRGKLASSAKGARSARLIPAHAGKTAAWTFRPSKPTAHPRSRGENRPRKREAMRPPGSSPLTRGKLVVALLVQVLDGLIPAHAGKTRWVCLDGRWRRAHPRSRGENIASSFSPLHLIGSSPLTRGKP